MGEKPLHFKGSLERYAYAQESHSADQQDQLMSQIGPDAPDEELQGDTARPTALQPIPQAGEPPLIC